jgi:hypothetical protein
MNILFMIAFSLIAPLFIYLVLKEIVNKDEAFASLVILSLIAALFNYIENQVPHKVFPFITNINSSSYYYFSLLIST